LRKRSNYFGNPLSGRHFIYVANYLIWLFKNQGIVQGVQEEEIGALVSAAHIGMLGKI